MRSTPYLEAVLRDRPMGLWPLHLAGGGMPDVTGRFPALVPAVSRNHFLNLVAHAGRGPDLDGVDDGIYYNGAGIDIPAPFTVEVWFRNESTAFSCLSSTRSSSSGGDNTFDWRMDAGRWNYDIGNGSSWIATNQYVSVPWQVGGAGHHAVTVVRVGSLEAWLDGKLAATLALPAGTPKLLKTNQGPRWGYEGLSTNNYHMNGQLQWGAYYGTALGRTQIRRHFLAGRGRLDTGGRRRLAA